MSKIYEQAEKTSSYSTIQVDHLSLLTSETVVIDVREVDEWVGELGHLPQAIHIPLGHMAASEKSLDQSKEYLMVCRSGGRSGRAAEYLASCGFSKVINLAGGMLAVNAAGIPVNRH